MKYPQKERKKTANLRDDVVKTWYLGQNENPSGLYYSIISTY